VKAYPKVNIIMAHSGFMMHTVESIDVALECPNIYLEQSAAISRGCTDSVQAIGPRRVLMGSDTPYTDFGVEIRKIEVAIDRLEDRKLVMGENIVRLGEI
jgi:predicted TIM-barrel fold metal-dependent hydrolase